MPSPTDTRAKILASADRLLRSHGFSGFSYQDIARPLGIRNAAVHYHFSTKADLALAVIERYRQLLRDRTGAFMASGGDAVEQLEGFIAFSTAECCQQHTMCPVGALSAEFYSLPDAVQAAAQRLLDELLAWMTRVCALGREQGRMHFEGDAAAKAQQIVASLQGARQLARFRGAQAMRDVAEQLRRDLGLGAPAAARE
jgi:TetR/AcrR family transcriptional regulator, transcriptional repressor for nem operon